MNDMNNLPYSSPGSNNTGLSPDKDSFIPKGRSVPFINGAKWIDQGFKMATSQPKTWLIVIAIFAVLDFIATLLIQNSPSLSSPISISMLIIEMLLFAGVLCVAESQRQTGHADLNLIGNGFVSRTGAIGGVIVIQLLIIIVAVITALAMLGMSAVGHIEKLIYAMQSENYDLASQVMTAIGLGNILLSFLVMFVIVIISQMLCCFAIPLIVLKRQPFWRSLSQSFNGCLKNILPGLVYFLCLFITLIIFGVITGFIPMPEFVLSIVASVFKLPLWYLSLYFAYLNIFTDSEQEQDVIVESSKLF